MKQDDWRRHLPSAEHRGHRSRRIWPTCFGARRTFWKLSPVERRGFFFGDNLHRQIGA